MKLPAYPKYKPSGVPWLHEVPEHWGVGPVKLHISRVESGTSVNASDAPAENGEFGVLKTSCVYSGSFRPEENKTVLETDFERVSCPLKAGTLIVSRMNTPELIGAAGVVTTAAGNLFLPDRLWQISFKHADVRFVHFWTLTSSYRAQVESACTGTSSSMKNLGQDQFGSFTFSSPPLVEQRCIADFLVAETGRIDTLVAKKRTLVERLKEKRTALISRTVTRGLPPDAARAAGLDPHPKLKPSGIDWLGDVPAHWEVLPFTKYVADRSDYRGKTPEKTEDGVFLVTAKNVRMGFIDYETSQEYVAADEYDEIMRRGLPKKGDILFTTEAPLGNVALVDREDVALAQRIIRFRMNPAFFSGGFTLYAMMSDHFQVQLQSLSTGSTAEGLKASKLPILRIVAPPLEEQKIIASFLNRETMRIDQMLAKVESAIDRLQEYRTALITAAVTGKIDVRQASSSG